ncbi:hypothetical protein KUCAC02_011608, partial [Chaenocephalus aceratus]
IADHGSQTTTPFLKAQGKLDQLSKTGHSCCSLPITAPVRQEYKEIRTKLRQKGIDSFIIYPAILK